MEGPLALKRVYKALKKNPNSTPEEIAAAKTAYQNAKASAGKRKRDGVDSSSSSSSSSTPSTSRLKRQRPSSSTPSSVAYCSSHSISVRGADSDMAPYQSFASTPFNATMQHVLTSSYKEPTPVQAQAWPIVLSGRDVVSVAKTGSGVTRG